MRSLTATRTDGRTAHPLAPRLGNEHAGIGLPRQGATDRAYPHAWTVIMLPSWEAYEVSLRELGRAWYRGDPREYVRSLNRAMERAGWEHWP